MSQLASRKLTPSCNMMRQRRPSRASIVVSYTYSTIFEDEGDEGAGPEGGGERQTIVSATVRSDDYSVSEMSETFTIVQKGDSIGVHPHSEGDTDVEDEDDGFDEYSEVTFEQPTVAAKAPVRARKNTVFAAPALGTHSHGDSSIPCRCAETYRQSREKRRRAVSTVVNMHQQSKAVQSTSEDTSCSESGDELSKLGRVRKKSKFGAVKEEEAALVEGVFKLEANKNYEEYLAAIGTGPCSADMVMRAAMTLTVMQDMDKQWRLSNETVIKAKSVRGYKTNNRKWTENKFKAGEAKPELMDDWDQRLVVTTLTVEGEGSRLLLTQQAEKDQMHCKDSTVELEVAPEEPEVLIMTCKVEGVTAWRRYLRQKPSKFNSRKVSAPF